MSRDDPTLLAHLLRQVGYPYAPRPSGLDTGLDRSTNVVGMDVTVPQSILANYDD